MSRRRLAQQLLPAGLAAQSAALDRGRVRAVDLASAYLDAIDIENRRLNAYLAIDPERVLAEAAASDARRAEGRAGALEGLCVAVKDNLDVAGYRTTAGMATRREHPPASQDAPAIARLRAAGAILLGKLNLHEAALGADNDNPHYGRCHNPHRPGYSPGGSSGGSAAAVAAGLCAAAIGTDSMGSVRIPASYCGVCGFKPAFGAVPTEGSVPVSHRLDTVGVLAQNASDALRVVQAMATRPIRGRVSKRALRIGIPGLGGVVLAAEVAAVLAAARRRLGELGHRLFELPAPEPPAGRLRRAGLLRCEAEMLVEHADDWRLHRERFSPALTGLLAYAEGRSAIDLAAADRLLDAGSRQVHAWLARCDLLLWPTTPQMAFAFGSPVPASQADLTCHASIAGVPALSLPWPVDAGSLPVGLQLIGAAGSETTMAALADRLSRAEKGA